ncbi:MBL fold metallo-hydrolase [Pedobacter immunditicola]|uniref:MBL fold metallo-hydrolase n=1 Tax=Pedobacter immunditicola TaxID=3133440 RepID=UPI0030AFCF2A
MKIEQFEDKNLSHYSYAIINESNHEIVLIDPARDPKPYYDLAHEHDAKIIGVIETHPHADFVSSHLQIQKQQGAQIFASKLMNPEFSFTAFDEGAVLEFGEVKLKAMNTPGHSPDSISVVLEHEGKDKAVFTGDTLFIGDCGRPDLREQGENLELKREQLAKKMYSSLRNKLMTLDNEVLVYPAHGAGTLCGKALSKANSSTIGAEKSSNWSLQDMSESEFVAALTADQPFIPMYFPYNVELNKKGAPNFKESVTHIVMGQKIDNSEKASRLDPQMTIIDTRKSGVYKKQHLKNSINIMDGDKFETWLGALVSPGDLFYLAGDNDETLTVLMERIAKIGYETFIKEAFVLDFGLEASAELNFEAFKENPFVYTIVDIRNESEAKNQPAFKGSINIPLPELNKRFNEIPTDKPIVVHCAGGYRSAAGSSMLENRVNVEVFDLSDNIKEFIGGH